MTWHPGHAGEVDPRERLQAAGRRLTDPAESLAQRIAERALDLIVQALDVNQLVQRVDLNALLEQVDINRILARVDVNALLKQVNVNALLGQVDVNALIGRVDVDALLGAGEYQRPARDVRTSTTCSSGLTWPRWSIASMSTTWCDGSIWTASSRTPTWAPSSRSHPAASPAKHSTRPAARPSGLISSSTGGWGGRSAAGSPRQRHQPPCSTGRRTRERADRARPAGSARRGITPDRYRGSWRSSSTLSSAPAWPRSALPPPAWSSRS